MEMKGVYFVNWLFFWCGFKEGLPGLLLVSLPGTESFMNEPVFIAK